MPSRRRTLTTAGALVAGLALASLASPPGAAAPEASQVSAVAPVHARAGTSATIGQVAASPDTAASCGSAFTAVQASSAAPQPYVVPAAGVITSFSTAARTTPLVGSVRAVMFVPAGAGTYAQVGKSALAAVTPAVLNTFPTRIPVPAGATLGMQFTNPSMACGVADAGSSLEYLATYDPDNPVPFTGTPASYLLNAAAVWESDADADGFGDVTQDLCPQSARSQAACPAPDTRVKSAPKATPKAKIKISFVSSVPGSTFTCSVDGKPAKPCSSPFRKRYSLGKHKVRITATSPAGIVEAKPATVKFRRIAPR